MGEKESNPIKNPHEIHGDSLVRAVKDQVSCDLAGEAAILDLKTGLYYGLDVVGARIWDLIKEEKRVNDVRDTILEEYNVEAKQCEEDLLELLNQLADAGLIEVRETSESS